MNPAVLITFLLYFLFLLAIGIYFSFKSSNSEEYLLGGRSMGAWVTALSAQASDMSGWLLMGLPGAIFLFGMEKVWIAVGLFAGTCLNWFLVSKRLRVYTEKTQSITIPCFLEQRFRDQTGLLRTLSSLIIVFFFTTYASSGLIATGKLFESSFQISYQTAILCGGSVIILYTFLGGFKAVCWTDLFQGALMVIAIAVVPSIAIGRHTEPVSQPVLISFRDLVPNDTVLPLVAILSSLTWGLGYFGQPHILTRFMSVKSLKKLSQSRRIAIVWAAVSLAGAVWIGMVAQRMFQVPSPGDEEKVFIYMIRQVCPAWISGIMLAAILSAIMSTIDSQLLVFSSALTEDFYLKVIHKSATEKQLLWIGRISVLIISIIAMILAFLTGETILKIVAYSWGGLGAALGPLILFSLFSRKTTWYSALTGMITGTITLVLWNQSPLQKHLYELLPGFLVNGFTIWMINQFCPQKKTEILNEFDAVAHSTTCQI